MTCIVGLKDGDTVYMGADSLGVTAGNFSSSIREDRKVFHNGEFLIGFTSSFRMGQILQYKFKPRAQEPGQSDMEYMVNYFVEDCRKCLEENKYTKDDHQFLVSYRGNLYDPSAPDWQVQVNSLGMDTVGSGSAIALGALYATQHLPPIKRIHKALEAASAWNAGVGAPFHVLKQTYNPRSAKTRSKKR